MNIMEADIEIVGLPQDESSSANGAILGLEEKVRKVYESITIPREEIDPKVLSLEEDLHKKNEERAKLYGKNYIKPQVLYLDKFAFHSESEKIEEKMEVEGLKEILGSVSGAPSAVFMNIQNTTLVFANSFQDKEADSYNTAFLMRHELGHAGSIRKLRVHETAPKTFSISSYRTGGQVGTEKRGVGIGFTEGHNSIEDALNSGELRDNVSKWKADRFFSLDQSLDNKFPEGIGVYLSTKRDLSESGSLPEGKILTGYKTTKVNEFEVDEAVAYGNDCKEYRELMTEIYNRDPELFQLAEDFIYGDKMLSFAKKADISFGGGFFHKLMETNTPESAQKLLNELKDKTEH